MDGLPALSAHDAAVLRARIAADRPGGTDARRARMVLMSAEGMKAQDIAEVLRCSERTVVMWRERYRLMGAGGLRDSARAGRPVTVSDAVVLQRTVEAPPGGRTRWSSRLLGAELGISNVSVANVWRAWGVLPIGSGMLRFATEPLLDVRVLGIAGLHLVPPRRRCLAVIAAVPGTVPRRPVRHDVVLAGEDVTASDFLALASARAAGQAMTDMRLLVAGDEPAAGPAAVHVVRDGISWARVAAVASAAAGLIASDADALVALRDVLDADDLAGCAALLTPRRTT